MTPRRSGFILIIVLGLLGVLAFLALNLVESSRQAMLLGHAHMDVVRSRLLARSGIELVLARFLVGQSAFDVPPRAVGEGTRKAGGDTIRARARDTSGSINLNDGLEAARLERGDHQADNAMEQFEVEPVFNLTCQVIHRRYAFPTGATLNLARAGDKVAVLNTNGVEVDQAVVTGIGSVKTQSASGAPLVPVPTLEVDHMLPSVTAGTYQLVVTREKPLGLFNLRLRHLLNAYGDAHRFVEQLDWPVWRRSDWNSGTGQYNTPFIPTSTALGNMGDPTPGLSSAGLPLVAPQQVADSSTGLGDRLIAARPMGGYKDLEQVEDMVRLWADTHLATPEGRDGLVSRVSLDLTVHSAVDTSFTRMKREFGKRRKPLSRDFKLSGRPLGSSYAPVDAWATSNQFLLSSLSRGNLDFTDLFTPHPVVPVNLGQASPWVRAAVFWAPINVGYVAEGIRTAFEVLPPFGIGAADTHNYTSNPERFVGVSEPVFFRPTWENGMPAPLTAKKFMSLRDALVTTQAFQEYTDTVAPIRSFDDFREFLEWRVIQGVDYEKVEASTAAKNIHRLNGGRFRQDYAEQTLPHVMSCLRRIPGYLGAPQALLSTYLELDPLVWGPHGSTANMTTDWDWLRFHGGTHPVVKAEDFVSRETLPKVMFSPGGICELNCIGEVAYEGGRQVRSEITGHFEVFKWWRGRSQKDFVAITDPGSTDPMIRIGPENPAAASHYPHSSLGVVGLRDTPNAPTGTPALVHNFSHSLNSDVGPNPVLQPSQDDPTLAWLDTVSNSPAPTINWFEAPSSFLSGLEGPERPFLDSGNNGCDLSPFNGVSLLSINHGPAAEPVYRTFPTGILTRPVSPLWTFTDSLYWRPAVPVGGLLNPAVPTGSSAGVGSVSLWFRIPSGDRFPGDESDFQWMNVVIVDPGNTTDPTGPTGPGGAGHIGPRSPGQGQDGLVSHHPMGQGGTLLDMNENEVDPDLSQLVLVSSKSKTRGAFHMLASLNLWEKAEEWYSVRTSPQAITTNPSEGRPVTLQLGYVFDTTLRRGRLIGRYETRNRWQNPAPRPGEKGPIPEFFSASQGYTAWPGVAAPYAGTSNLMSLYNPILPFSSFDHYRAYDKVRVATTEIRLKNIPENGPGTWHRVTLAWDCRYSAAEPLKLVLHDASNIEAQLPVVFQENANAASLAPEPLSMMPWDSNMTFSVGEAHGRCRLLPDYHPFFSGDATDPNGEATRGFRTYAPLRYLPLWRLDSCIDNLRLCLGNRGDLTEDAERFDVSAEPVWVLKPSKVIPAKARIQSVGARIFEPLDENNNFPFVEISLDHGMTASPATIHSLDRAQGRVTERLHEYQAEPVQDATLKLAYRNLTPDGNNLVNDTSDNWSEIPWIMEVTIRYSEGGPRVLSWSMK